MDKQERAALIKALSDNIREYVSKFDKEVRKFISDEIRALTDLFEEKIRAVPEGKQGPPGATGAAGKDADPEVVRSLVLSDLSVNFKAEAEPISELQIRDVVMPALIAELDIGARGFRQKFAAILKAELPTPKEPDVALITAEVLRQIPAPKDGKDGERGNDGPAGIPGKDGASGRDGVNGSDGKDGSPGIQGERGADGLNGKDGASGAHGERGLDGKDGRDGRDGKDGLNGRDALELDILPAVDLSKSYPRGTFAKYRGGLIRAIRNTEPADTIERSGWDVIVEGLSTITVTHSEDLRTFTVRCELSSGRSQSTECAMPVLIHRGVYRAGNEYLCGDTVSQQGSSWTCIVERTTIPPATPNNRDWQLSVKAGRDGKDGKDALSVGPIHLK